MKKGLRHILFGILLLSPTFLFGQVSNAYADSTINAFNRAFLTTYTNLPTYNNLTTYRNALNAPGTNDGTWTLALDVEGMLDAYERTGTPAHKTLVTKLCNGYIGINNSAPFSWDGWNDDLAWMSLVMIRGYQMTKTTSLLNAAKITFDYCFQRGWNTQFNDGGIWEQQPDMTPSADGINKQVLSNNSNGQVACMLYQSTLDINYLNKAKQIYNWSRSHLYNPMNGQVYSGVDRDGKLNTDASVYNQGTFIDFATLLYEITKDDMYLRDAQMTADFTIANKTTANGIISRTDTYLNTWAGEFARGLGHLCMYNPQLWNKYYSFFKKNADAAWANRWTKYNITWNGWDTPTPADETGFPSRYVSTVDLMQFTPTIQSLTDTIEAENYNYQKGITVDTIPVGGKCIGSISADDWIEYIVKVPTTGYYSLTFKVSSGSAASAMLQQNNVTLDTINIPGTGSLQTYTTVKSAINLTAGIQSIKLKAITGGWNIDKWVAKSSVAIVPSLSVNGAAAQQVSVASVNVGDNITLSPTPADGTWSWVGPSAYTAISKEISINNIQLSQGGVYTAKYVSPEGLVSKMDFVLSLNSCTPTDIVITPEVNSGAWTIAPDTIPTGSFVRYNPLPVDGTWTWIGPNSFTSTSRVVLLPSVSNRQAGNYTATYTNSTGCKTTKTIKLVLRGDDPLGVPITPHININGWQDVAIASVAAGSSFQFGPQAADNGSWRWTGPNGFTAVIRDPTVNSFSAVKAGTYKATYTNMAGYSSTKNFIIGLKGCSSTSITPGIMIDADAWNRTDSIVLISGKNITLTPPQIDGLWSWSLPNGSLVNTRELVISKVTNFSQGKYSLTYVDGASCVNTYSVVVKVVGNDYFGTAIVPYIVVNNGLWMQKSSAVLKVGDTFKVGPQPSNNNGWGWVGPASFSAATREITVSKILLTQFGVYKGTYTNNLGGLSFANITISQLISGVEDPVQASGIGVYPNPATDKMFLTGISSNSQIIVFDLSGRALFKTTTTTGVNGVEQVNVSSLKAGSYFVKVIGNETVMLKLIKK